MRKAFCLIISCLVIGLMFPVNSIGETSSLDEMYTQAQVLLVQGDYSGAAAIFDALGAYSDSSMMSMYCKAISMAEDLEYYDMAINTFNDLDGFKDSRQMADYYRARKYAAAGTIDIENASYAELSKALDDLGEAEKIYGSVPLFKDSMTRMKSCQEERREVAVKMLDRQKESTEGFYLLAIEHEENGEYKEAYELYERLKGYKDCTERMKSIKDHVLYIDAESYYNDENYDDAIQKLLEMRTETPESLALLEKAYEGKAIQNYYAGDLDTALSAIGMLGNKSERIISIEKEINDFVKKYSKWLGKWSYSQSKPKCALWIRAQYKDGLVLAFESGKTTKGEVIVYDLHSHKKDTIVYHSDRFSAFDYTTLRLVKDGVIEESTKSEITGTSTSKTKMYRMGVE